MIICIQVGLWETNEQSPPTGVLASTTLWLEETTLSYQMPRMFCRISFTSWEVLSWHFWALAIVTLNFGSDSHLGRYRASWGGIQTCYMSEYVTLFFESIWGMLFVGFRVHTLKINSQEHQCQVSGTHNTVKFLHQTHFHNLRDRNSPVSFGFSCLCFCTSLHLNVNPTVFCGTMLSWAMSPCAMLPSPLGLFLALTMRHVLRFPSGEGPWCYLASGPGVSERIKFGNLAQSPEDRAVETLLLCIWNPSLFNYQADAIPVFIYT